jgi:hypothetical protein
MPTRVMLMGLGPIGAGVARQLAVRKSFKIVAAVDVDAAKAGKKLEEVAGLEGRTGIKVADDPVAAARKAKPDVAVLCTSSSLRKVWPQIETLLKLKLPIVSTTEEVCGIVQDGIGDRGGKPAIVLHMEAYLGAPETYDSVTIEGSPPLSVKASGGYHGDVATASITVNSIPKVLEARPGLHTMRSLALPSFAG